MKCMLNNIFKYSLVTIVILTQYSCVAKKGVKKIENQVKSILESKKDVVSDTDGDLIENNKEIELGTNPTVPNIPALNINNVQRLVFNLKMQRGNDSKNLEIVSSIRNNDDLRESINKISQEWFISALNKIHYEQILPTSPSIDVDNLLSTGGLSAIPLQKKAFFEYSDLLDDGWRLIDGSIKAEARLSGVGMEYVSFIDKISVSMGTISKHQSFRQINTFGTLYNSSGTPLVLNNTKNEADVIFDNNIELYSNNVDITLLDKILKAQVNVALFVNDFRFQRTGITNTFSELSKSVGTKNTKILIKDEGKISYFYTLNNKTINEFFNGASISVSHDSAYNLTGLFEKESSLKLPISSNGIESQETGNGNWRILNGDIPINSNLNNINALVISYVNVEDIKGASDKNASLRAELFKSKEALSIDNSKGNISLLTLSLSKKEDFTEQGENAISKSDEICEQPRRGGSAGGGGRGGRDSDNDTPPSCRTLNYRCHVVWNTLNTKLTTNIPFDSSFLDINKFESNQILNMSKLDESDIFLGGNGRVKIIFSPANELRKEIINVSVGKSKMSFPLKIGNRHLQKSPKLGNCGSPLDYEEKTLEGSIIYSLSGEILTLNKNSYFDLVD